jgi:Superfamily II helicase and inactivated derivatives
MKDQDIIKQVKAKNDILLSYIDDSIRCTINMMLVHLTGENAFKRPNWLGYNSQTYDATKLKDKILEEFKAHPGMYGYGILLGKQPVSGVYIVCIDIDIDNECKNEALEDLKRIFEKHKIDYFVEQTKSCRYHIYVALDGMTETLQRIRKLKYKKDCFKYKSGKTFPGEIELLGASRPHMSTIYSNIINDEKPPVFNQLKLTPPGTFELALLEFQSIAEIFEEVEESAVIEENEEIEEIEESEESEDREPNIDMFVEFFKLTRKYNYTNGWDIDRVVSAVCVKNNMTNDEIHRIFEEIFQGEYDWKTTERLIVLTKEKNPETIPSLGSVIHYAKEMLKDNQLTNDEKKFLSDFIAVLNKHNKLPRYLLDAEKVYLAESMEKKTKDNKTYYREWWYIERKIKHKKKVYYVEIETSYPEDIYKPHKLVARPRVAGIKIDIRRILQIGASRVYEVIINDDPERIVTPPFDFDRLEDLAIAIAKQCSDLIGRFDIPLFQDYISIKLDEFDDKHGGKPILCLISKTTGWDKDNKLFFHYDLNDEKHELSKDNTLYKHNKAESFHQIEQHDLVYDLLQEGKLLGVLLTISTASILLKPLELQPLTCIIAGNSSAGKTTACLIATSLFYKSDELLITADTTRVGSELTLVSLNSLPITIDESALAESSAYLKHLIFSVASKRGRTRGKKDLSVETKDILSCVFWTTETTDTDEIRRSGAFRRMLYIVVENWEQFTMLFNLKNFKPHRLYAGCGVDYIRYVIENLNKLRIRFEDETKDFGDKYPDITGIAETLYAGIILLEEFYTYYLELSQTIIFTELRKTVDALLENAKKTFIASKTDIVSMFEQYLLNNLNRFGQVDFDKYAKADGSRDIILAYQPTTKEILGEYDRTTQTFKITPKGMEVIARELEKERTLLHKALLQAGVISKEAESKYLRILGKNSRVYVVKFNDPSYSTDIEPNL